MLTSRYNSSGFEFKMMFIAFIYPGRVLELGPFPVVVAAPSPCAGM